MVSSNLLCVGFAGVIAFSLHGCGGGASGDDPTPRPTASPAATTLTTTLTTTTDFCANANTVPPGSDSENGKLVDWLNSLYTGYKADDPASPSGVTIRVADDFSFFCNSACHNGYPDCRISASLYNHKMMMMHDTFSPAVTMSRFAGIVFNQTTVEVATGKCAYLYDGATFNRVNRGCGCAARQVGCGQQGAYWNQDCQYGDPVNHQNIRPETCHNNTETSEDVERCWCKTENLHPSTPRPEDATTTDQQCFFRAGGLYPPHPLQSEFHDFVKARLANQETNGGIEEIKNVDGVRYKQEYWNEVVVDAEVLGNMLRNPNVTNTNAVSAFMYVEGNGDGKLKAVEMQKKAFHDYGYPIIPIVAFDATVDVRCSGPFKEASGLPTTSAGPAPWEGGCSSEFQQCGGIGNQEADCCEDGLVCMADPPDNLFWSSCQKNETKPTILERDDFGHIVA